MVSIRTKETRRALIAFFPLLAFCCLCVNVTLSLSTSNCNAAGTTSLLHVPLPTNETMTDQVSLAQQQQEPPPSSNTTTGTRLLVGLFSFGVSGQGRAFKRRLKFRNYFSLTEDKRICPLSLLVYGKRRKRDKSWDKTVDTSHCQFIYTFVTGFVPDDDANNETATTLPTELLSDDVPIDNRDAFMNRVSTHPGDMDLTFLNIRENMNEGKSQTWFKYASQIMEQHDIDYAIKTDTDCLIAMDHFFHFVSQNLPKDPQHSYYVGRLADKAFWGGSRQYNSVDGPSTVHRMRKTANVQIYMSGELYILSRDLVKWVSKESFRIQRWYEEVEDHDVGLRVYDYPLRPVFTVRIQQSQQFWIHPAKTHAIWNVFMDRETQRKLGHTNYTAAKTTLGDAHYQRLFDAVYN